VETLQLAVETLPPRDPAPDQGPRHAAADTLGKLIDEKSAQQFECKLEQEFEDHREVIMALLVQLEKEGKRCWIPTMVGQLGPYKKDPPGIRRMAEARRALLESPVSVVNEELLVGDFGGAQVEPQIVAAGGLQPHVPKDIFNVPNRAAVKQQLGCGRVP